jgi:hypothetical protein
VGPGRRTQHVFFFPEAHAALLTKPTKVFTTPNDIRFTKKSFEYSGIIFQSVKSQIIDRDEVRNFPWDCGPKFVSFIIS